MRYFNSLPQVNVTDTNGNITVATNIIARNYLVPSLKNNVNIMYKYDIKEGDTPENIAYRYYGSTDRFWMVLFANNIMDPQWEWPLSSKQFDAYIINKYAVDANSTDSSIVLSYTQSTAHHYEQDLITFNSQDGQKQTVTIEIDQDTFQTSLDQSVSMQFPNGVVATRQVNYRQVSIYDYEVGKNESNRRINIINSSYVNQIEKQFQSLMS